MEFIKFGRLPVELRILIWKKSLEATVIHLQSVRPAAIRHIRGPIISHNILVSEPVDDRNHAVPQVTREARHVAIDICHLQPVPTWKVFLKDTAEFRRYLRYVMAKRIIYVNWERDLFYLPERFMEVLLGVFPLSPTFSFDIGSPPIRRVVLHEYSLRQDMDTWAFESSAVADLSGLDEVYIMFPLAGSCLDDESPERCDWDSTDYIEMLWDLQRLPASDVFQWARDRIAPQTQLCGHAQHSFIMNSIVKHVPSFVVRF